jgi:surfeit locus 1 family protein
MPAGYSFRPRAWSLALALAACAAGIALGNWQSRRAEEKRALGARLEQVSVHGEFVAGRSVLLDNKTRRGRVGYEVVTPLKLKDSMHVLVNRGWIARERISELRTPAGEVRIEGIALERLPHALELERNTGGKIRQNLDLAEFARETGLALQPVVIEQHGGPADGLLREWPRPDAGSEKHAAYALQWYSLAALAVALAVVLAFRKNEDSSK